MCVLIKRVYFPVESRISARKALISNIHVPLLAEAVASESVCTLLYMYIHHWLLELRTILTVVQETQCSNYLYLCIRYFFFCRLTMEVRWFWLNFIIGNHILSKGYAQSQLHDGYNLFQWLKSSTPLSSREGGLRLKGSMHHTHDVSWEDVFCIIHVAAGFYFRKFFTIS